MSWLDYWRRKTGIDPQTQAAFDPQTLFAGEDESERVRYELIFYGRVQGVGFRYSATYACKDLGLTGTVENLSDGSVRMEVQGTRPAIRLMIAQLQKGNWIQITDIAAKQMVPDPSESGFRVISSY